MAQKFLAIVGGQETEVVSTAMPLAGGTFTGAVNHPGSGIWDATGKLGVGIATPLGPLHSYADGTAADTIGGSVILNRYYASSTNLRAGAIWSMYSSTTGQDVLAFGVSNTTTPLDTAKIKMIICNDGKVGIGTMTPGYLLDVLGTARVTALLTAPVAFASLPTGAAGMRAFVNNNSAAAAFGSAANGSGAVTYPVYHDGTSWKVG